MHSQADRPCQCSGNGSSATAISESNNGTETTLDILDAEQGSLNDENTNTQQMRSKMRIWKLTLWLVLLFVYSTLTRASLELVACQRIGSKYLSYFATTYECFSDYGGWQYVLFLLVFAVTVFPGVVTWHTWRELRAGKTAELLSEPFKPEFCWWEGMLMTRRLVLTVISVLPITLIQRQAMLACMCVVLAVIQTRCLPFKSSDVNDCESILMLFLAIISVLSMLKHQVIPFTMRCIHTSLQVDDAAMKGCIIALTVLPVLVAACFVPWR